MTKAATFVIRHSTFVIDLARLCPAVPGPMKQLQTLLNPRPFGGQLRIEFGRRVVDAVRRRVGGQCFVVLRHHADEQRFPLFGVLWVHD
jgi:hypothetical protein